MPTSPILPTSNPSSRRLQARRISTATNNPSSSRHDVEDGLTLPRPVLSEKARGKRRAVNLPPDLALPQPLSSYSSGHPLLHRYTQTQKSDHNSYLGVALGLLRLRMNRQDREGVLPSGSLGRGWKIKSLRPSLHSNPLKIIHSGRLLTDGILLLPYITALEERHKNVNTSAASSIINASSGGAVGAGKSGSDIHAKGKGKGKGRGEGENGVKEKIWVHCVVGAVVVENKEDGGDEDGGPAEGVVGAATDGDAPTTSTLPSRRRGFDALLDAGLSAAEVDAMRRQFYAGRGEEVPEGIGEDDEHARALEEQWIEGDLTHETAQTAQEGLYTSILQGLLTGFLIPIVPWFFFREVPAPNFFEPWEAEADRRWRYQYQREGRRRARVEQSENGSDWEDVSEGEEEGVAPSGGTSSARVTLPQAGRRVTSTTHRGGLALSYSPGGTTLTIEPETSTGGGGSGGGETGPNAGRGLFGLRNRPGGDWVTGVIFGQRVQMAIFIGTILNIVFGALRFLV